MKFKRVRFIVVLLLLLTPSFLISAQETAALSTNQAELALIDLSGQPQSLSQYRGRIVVLNFWATWCLPCREEMPLLVAAQTRYGNRGVQVIGASADDDSTKENIPRFVRQLKLNFPIWQGATTTDMQRFGLGDALPATAIIDRDGQIVGRIIGVVEAADLQHRLEWLLGDRQSPAPTPLVNNLPEHDHDHKATGKDEHDHEGEEDHEHGGVGLEGASSVPS